jgi:hypothetical protein
MVELYKRNGKDLLVIVLIYVQPPMARTPFSMIHAFTDNIV